MICPLPPLRRERRRARILVAAVLLVGLPGWLLAETVATDERILDEFSSVEIQGSMEVEVRSGRAQRLWISAEPHVIADITTTVEDETLVVRPGRGYQSRQPVRVHIELPRLDALEARGALRVRLSGLHGPRLDLDLAGSTSATAEGAVDRLEARLTDATQLQARALDCRDAVAQAGGAAKAWLHVRRSLEADLSGAAQLHYRGDPQTLRVRAGGASRVSPE